MPPMKYVLFRIGFIKTFFLESLSSDVREILRRAAREE
jgi:hypothetical protein